MITPRRQEPIPEPERELLLHLARAALESVTRGDPLAPLELGELPPRLRQNGVTFVTLTRGGELRGCIGGLKAEHPLAEDVRLHTEAAALEDPRFPPVNPEEVAEIAIEISVLSEPTPLLYDTPEDLLHLLRPHIDGVILVSGLQRATFLPQVWEKVPDPEQFLEMLCAKASLPPNAWQESPLAISTYQVESFHETSLGEDAG